MLLMLRRSSVRFLAGKANQIPRSRLPNLAKPTRSSLFQEPAPSLSTNSITSSSLPNRQTPQATFDSIVTQLEELKDQNPDMKIEVTTTKDQLTLTFDKKKPAMFKLSIAENGQLSFECPSGPSMQRLYKQDESGNWISIVDGHNMLGLFLRDLIPHIQGLPRWAFS